MKPPVHRLLSSRFAQQIVDQVAATLEQNLNLMDAQGIIIASRDPSRIGDVHPGAQRVIQTGERVLIHPGDEQPGTRAGVNLPLRSGDDVIGVVGVTGNPDEIAPITQVVQLATQLLVDHAAEQDATERREAADRSIVTGLILGDASLPWVQHQLTDSDRPIAPPWTMTVLLPRDRSAGVPLHGLSSHSTLSQDRGRWVEFRGAMWVLGTASDMSTELIRMVAERETLREVTAPTTSDMASLRAGAQALAALVERPAVLDNAPDLSRLEDLPIELAVAYMPLDHCRLLAQRISALSAVHRDTVETLAAHARIADATRSLHAHRNTVAQRMKRIHAVTGLNPGDPRHLLTLSLAVCAARVVKNSTGT